MRHNFWVIYGYGLTQSVGEKIGGKVGENIALGLKDPSGFTNPCALRMSYVLNYSGAPVRPGPWHTVSGADKMLYIFRLRDLLTYLQHTFGTADKTIKRPKESDFSGMQGIIVFSGALGDATGHTTLWDGRTCSDECYFLRASEASVWTLS